MGLFDFLSGPGSAAAPQPGIDQGTGEGSGIFSARTPPAATPPPLKIMSTGTVPKIVPPPTKPLAQVSGKGLKLLQQAPSQGPSVEREAKDTLGGIIRPEIAESQNPQAIAEEAAVQGRKILQTHYATPAQTGLPSWLQEPVSKVGQYAEGGTSYVGDTALGAMKMLGFDGKAVDPVTAPQKLDAILKYLDKNNPILATQLRSEQALSDYSPVAQGIGQAAGGLAQAGTIQAATSSILGSIPAFNALTAGSHGVIGIHAANAINNAVGVIAAQAVHGETRGENMQQIAKSIATSPSILFAHTSIPALGFGALVDYLAGSAAGMSPSQAFLHSAINLGSNTMNFAGSREAISNYELDMAKLRNSYHLSDQFEALPKSLQQEVFDSAQRAYAYTKGNPGDIEGNSKIYESEMKRLQPLFKEYMKGSPTVEQRLIGLTGPTASEGGGTQPTPPNQKELIAKYGSEDNIPLSEQSPNAIAENTAMQEAAAKGGTSEQILQARDAAAAKTREIEQLQQDLAHHQSIHEQLSTSPSGGNADFTKNILRSTGRLPELSSESTSGKFGTGKDTRTQMQKSGDDKANELGFPDYEHLRDNQDSITKNKEQMNAVQQQIANKKIELDKITKSLPAPEATPTRAEGAMTFKDWQQTKQNIQEAPVDKTTRDMLMKQLGAPPAASAQPLLENMTGQQPKEGEVPGQRQRGFFKTVTESENTSPGLHKVLAQMDQTYTPQSTEDHLKIAQDYIKEDLEGAKAYVLDDKSPNDFSKGVLQQALMKHYASIGDVETTKQLIAHSALQGTTEGQFIQTYTLWNRLSPEGMLKYAQDEVESTNKRLGAVGKAATQAKIELTPEDEKFILQKMNQREKMQDGPEKDKVLNDVLQRIADKTPPGWSQIFDAYRYSNMLADTKPLERKWLSYLTQTLVTRPVDLALSTPIDWLKSTLTGKEREYYVGDAFNWYRDVVKAMGNGTVALKETLKGNPHVDEENLARELKNRQLPKVLQMTSRVWEAGYNYFKVIITAAEKSRLLRTGASDSAATEGAKQLAATLQFRRSFNAKDTNNPYITRAIEGVGQLLQNAQRMPAIGIPIRIAIPFLRMPFNFASASFERIPLVGQFGGKGASWKTAGFTTDTEQWAKGLGGTIVMAIGAMLALAGKTTWDAPTDPKERDEFYAVGHRPFCIEINGIDVPASTFGIWALPLLLPAAVIYYFKESKTALTDSTLSKLAQTVEGVAKYSFGSSALSNFTALMRMIDGDQSYTAASEIGFMGTQFIPASHLIAHINTLLEPIYRKAPGLTGPLQNMMPGLSTSLDPYINTFTKQPESRLGVNAVLPYDVGAVNKKFDTEYRQNIQRRQLNYKPRGKSAPTLGDTLNSMFFGGSKKAKSGGLQRTVNNY